MKDNIESEYLEKNSSFHIERALLHTFDDKELRDFISDIYSEYTELESLLQERQSDILLKYKNLSEISQYMIELLIFQYSEEGKRYTILKNILEKIDFHLKKEEISDNGYSITDIDIHQIPIVDVIGKYSQLPKNTRRNIICPIHREKSPSLKIYSQTNSWFCFGCRRGGNAINFISYMENISTKEAFKVFANLYFNN